MQDIIQACMIHIYLVTGLKPLLYLFILGFLDQVKVIF